MWKHSKISAVVGQDIGPIKFTLIQFRYINARGNKIHGKSSLFLLSPELDLSRLEFHYFIQ